MPPSWIIVSRTRHQRQLPSGLANFRCPSCSTRASAAPSPRITLSSSFSTSRPNPTASSPSLKSLTFDLGFAPLLHSGTVCSRGSKMSIADGIHTLSTRAVVEDAPQGASPTYEVVLPGLRIRQQKLLARLGVDALARVPIPDLLQRGAEAAALGLDARFCKVCQYVPAENRLVMRAGVGWQPGCLNNASVGADLESPSGFALKTGRPVISNHLEHEERFRPPDLLRQHGIRRAINVILQGEGSPYGVLEVDSELEGQFNADDIHFLQGAANILGMALERDLHDKKLRQALEYQQMLVGEIDHRVKNSLQLVSSVLQLQADVSEYS